MEHTKEFLMGMFAAYYGSPVLETHNYGDTITDVIDWEFLSRYKYNDVDGKPILTPLSEITDDDAAEVAKIMLKKEDDWIPVRIERNEAYIEVVSMVRRHIADTSSNLVLTKCFIQYLFCIPSELQSGHFYTFHASLRCTLGRYFHFPDLFSSWGFLFTFTANKCKDII